MFKDGNSYMVTNINLFFFIDKVRTPDLTYFMHCTYQMSEAHEDKSNLFEHPYKNTNSSILYFS